MSPQWRQRYDEIDRLEREGKIRVVEKERVGWDGDPRYAVEAVFVRTCPTCQSELTYINVEYMLRQIGKQFCRFCWRSNPDHPTYKKKYIPYPRQTDISLDFPVVRRKGVADIYARVSTRRQAEGYSLNRQEEYGIKFCQLNRIRVRNIIHDVCSAYTMDNLRKGNLGYKMREWEEGKEQPPQFLVVEDFDRLSRQHPWVVMGHLGRLKDLGIKLVVTGVCNDAAKPQLIL